MCEARKKKVLILIPRMGGGGAERVVSIVANHLCAKEDYEIRLNVLVSGEPFYPLDPRIDYQSAGFEVNRKNKFTRMISLGRNFLGAISYVKKVIREYRPDIVFSLLEEMDIVTYYALKGKRTCAFVCSERNDPTKRNKPLQKLLERIYKTVDLFVCQSQTVADYYSMVPASVKAVVPNPIDLKKIPERVEESTPPRVVAVGRLAKQKNFALLIDSFAEVAAAREDVILTIYGEGPERETLAAQIEAQGLSDRVILAGAQKNVLNYVRDAAVFVMSSDYEGFPNALVEAISVGVPVVTTNFPTGVGRELVTENVGTVVNCGDKAAMAKALTDLLSDDGRRARIRAEGYRATEPFAVETVIKQWEALFEKFGQ